MKIVTSIFFLLSLLLGMVAAGLYWPGQGTPDGKYLIYSILAAIGVVFYAAGIVVAFLNRPSIGLNIAKGAGLFSVVSLVAVLVWYVDKSISIHQIYMLPGLVGSVLLFFVHRDKAKR